VTILFAVKTPQTLWDEQNRVEHAAGSPLTQTGQEQAARIAGELAGRKVGAIYASEGEAEIQTARILAKKTGGKIRRDERLRELDYGLLQGLTVGEFKKRHAKIFKLWRESPEGFKAPSGETLEQLRKRVVGALREVARKQRGKPPVLVLRPVALAVLECIVHGEDVSMLWSHMDPDFTWTSFEIASERFKNNQV
jgi:broad specificity phosphatase PhoE